MFYLEYTFEKKLLSFQPMKKSCLRNICHNGCCQSSPCENGGTCREVCNVKARRFVCACPTGYSGHRCHKPLRSRHDILTSGRHNNGIYKIRNATNGTLNVYCHFDAEPGAAWTLVQSYTLEKGQNSSGNDIFSRKPLSHDFLPSMKLLLVTGQVIVCPGLICSSSDPSPLTGAQRAIFQLLALIFEITLEPQLLMLMS